MKTRPAGLCVVHDAEEFQGLGMRDRFMVVLFVEEVEVVATQIDKGIPAVCVESSGGPAHFYPMEKIVLLDGVHGFCVVVQFGVEQIPRGFGRCRCGGSGEGHGPAEEVQCEHRWGLDKG